MRIYHLGHLLKRAIAGVRRKPWLHLLSLVTLSAAFLSFSATLTAAINLDTMINRWVGSAEITVYLKDRATTDDLEQLTLALEQIEGVAAAEGIDRPAARDYFAADLESMGEIAHNLPASAFPITAEVHLLEPLSRDQRSRRELAARIATLEIVEDVEVYDNWFARLGALSLVGRIAVWGLGILAAVVVVLVIAAVVRVGVNSRRREIEVLRLAGATERYVKLPFLIEGALEATVGMALALLTLDLMLDRVHLLAGDLLPMVGASQLARLGSGLVIALVVASCLAGIAGAQLSLRRSEAAG